MSMSDDKVWVLIPAAGIGSRMQSTTPKQYLTLHGETILEHTIKCFLGLPEIEGILIVVSKSDEYWQSLYSKSPLIKNASIPIKVTFGGADRASTVKNGLQFLLDELGLCHERWVMIHDAARPCLAKNDLLALLGVRQAFESDGAILASKVKDTMKRSQKTRTAYVDHTESRENLWHALTPQLFRLQPLLECLNKAALAKHDVTDEASAMEFSGKQVALIEGRADNIKLTSPSDLPLLDFLLKK